MSKFVADIPGSEPTGTRSPRSWRVATESIGEGRKRSFPMSSDRPTCDSTATSKTERQGVKDQTYDETEADTNSKRSKHAVVTN